MPSTELKVKKAVAIKNFKAAMSARMLGGEEVKIVAFTTDGFGNPVALVFTPDEMLKEMENETRIGVENIEIWSADVNQEVEEIKKRYSGR
jgi:hypothetical protein